MKKIKEFLLNLNLKSKWAITSSIVIFISYAIICIVIFIALKTWLIHNEENTAMRTMDDLVDFFESQGPDLTIQQIQRNTSLMNAIVEKEQTVRIYNTDGIEILRINDTVSETAITIDGNAERTIERLTVDDMEVLVESQLLLMGRFTGYLQVVHPLTSVTSMLGYILTTMLIAGIGALLLSASVGYGLASILIRPIYELRDSMKKVKEEGFDVPVNLSYRANDEIGELHAIYNAMMSELQMAYTQQQQFVADASHELRTPIQALEGHLSMLKRWGKNDSEVLEESLDTSLLEIGRMKKLIEELLELARREQAVDIENARANVVQVSKQVVKELQTVYPDAGIQVTANHSQIEIAITENALGQILRNLLENAIRYSENTPKVEMHIYLRVDYAVIEIKDNGIGISEDELPYIFDRFYRVDAARNRKIGGTGLGLSITKLLIGKYYGNIEVKSVISEGSVFIVEFPLKN